MVKPYWERLSGPNLGDIERIKAQNGRISIFRLHDLNVGCVGDVLALFNSLPEILLGVVWVNATLFNGFLAGELFLTTIC